jgi:hypothetical protein
VDRTGSKYVQWQTLVLAVQDLWVLAPGHFWNGITFLIVLFSLFRVQQEHGNAHKAAC